MATGPITSWQIDGETMETVKYDSILKSRDITFLTNVQISQSNGFSSSHVWM